MPSLEEELLTEMPRLTSCCIVRVKREFQIRLNLFETVADEKQAPYIHAFPFLHQFNSELFSWQFH